MKRFLFLFGVAALTAIPQNYVSFNNQPVARVSFLHSQSLSQQNVFRDATLLLYMPMVDRGPGPFYDLSGNGFVATQIGIFQGFDIGKVGRFAPYFNKSAPNSYTISPAPTITVPFTVQAWVQPQAPNTNAYPRIVESFYSSGFFLGGDNTGKWEFVVNNTFISAAGAIVTGGWPNTPWTMLTGVYDGTNMFLYVNRVLASGPSPATSPGTKTIALAFGGCSSAGTSGCASAGNGWWDGQIGPVRIWTRALSAGEILTIYNAENH